MVAELFPMMSNNHLWQMNIKHKPKLVMLVGLIALTLTGCTLNNTQEAQALLTPVDRGAELYNTHCLSCHQGDSGGGMMDMPPRHNANGHTWHHPDCQLIDTVLNGSGEMGQMMRQMMGVPTDVPPMPTFKEQLTAEEIEAILAYIKTWWTEEQRQFQARITRELCG
jgi:mono/diheme cytochrome c family protein